MLDETCGVSTRERQPETSASPSVVLDCVC